MEVKQPKRLTRDQKKFLSKHLPRLNLDNWACAEENPTGYKFMNKVSGKILVVDKSGSYHYENAKGK